ncbi:thermosome subunit alpha [Haloparvum sedimenti]|uniref:thermosome subunit alpha n=1 Tax=Haloparvum sedimenti TaxID=1678448 RepID=UPI00071E88C7|nr:thermosome subunit alpha [Haloparvum sedimenti]
MQQPMYVLSEDSSRTRGRAAQDSNVRAGRAVANAVRTTLGPRGMDKMLVDTAGEVVITNDGATILREMDIEHPAAQMLVEVSETQEEAVGDGTTTAAVLAGELLARAEDLLDDAIHPSVIVEGYHEAARIAGEAIDEMRVDADLDDDLLARVAESSMTGKGTGDVAAATLAELVVEAVRRVETDEEIDRDDIRLHARAGAASSASELVDGILLDEEPATDDMPREVTDATVAVLDAKLEVRTGEADAEYAISSVDQLDAAIRAEDAELRGYAETLAAAGVDVLVCSKKIDDRVAGYLADAGILAFTNVSDADAGAVAAVTGAKRLGTLADLDADDLGTAASVSVERHGEDDLTFVRGGSGDGPVTLLLRGSTEHVLAELERAMADAVDVVVAAIEGGVVPGAGATEIAIADRVRSAAAGVEGRTQLAVEAFADAVEALPRTLAENAGIDPIDALVELRSTHESAGSAGIVTGERSASVGDPVAAGIVDPAAVKREAVASATEAARLILRIDDVIAAE